VLLHDLPDELGVCAPLPSFPTFIEDACQGAAENEDTSSLRNVGILRQHYTASHSRRQQFLSVNIFVNVFNLISTVVHSCVSIAMFLYYEFVLPYGDDT
jgi:hypothetical protein